MSDLIDRQAAIDAMRKAKDKSEAHRMLIQLPSAQPSISCHHENDMVSRQAALDAICEDGTQLERQGQYSITMAERKQRDADILEALLSAQPGWIPCKTALPEHDGEYLVTKKSFGWNCNEYTETDIARYEKKDGWHKADTVLAWCELPKPWEGGQP